MTKNFVILAFTLFSITVFAHDTHPTVDCRKLWDLERELGCLSSNAGTVPNAPTNSDKPGFVLQSQFGPTQCKASNTLEAAKKELKAECDSWVKERKADLGASFMTGSCSDKCDPCGQGLTRCLMTGLVHYTSKQ